LVLGGQAPGRVTVVDDVGPSDPSEAVDDDDGKPHRMHAHVEVKKRSQRYRNSSNSSVSGLCLELVGS